jgi:adenosylcobinamide kinase/adenosylcobinamide-phosphate guanylyltransferase
VRCGKSALALGLARGLGTRRLFIATAQAFDAEMHERIAAHRSERGHEFETLEEPLALPEVLAHAETDVVVVDCVTFWLSNMLLQDLTDEHIEARVGELLQVLRARRWHCVLVTNEVGMGVVPDNALARRFRDNVGRAHQQLAAVCDEVYFGVLGSMLRLRPAPVSLQRPEELYATHR